MPDCRQRDREFRHIVPTKAVVSGDAHGWLRVQPAPNECPAADVADASALAHVGQRSATRFSVLVLSEAT
jgi:hypothetical protein